MRFSGVEQVHRHQEGKPAQAGAGQIGEVDAAENLVGLEEYGTEIECAGEERQHVEQEVSEQPPLLHGVGDQEDGVERDLLRQEIRRDRQRAEQQQRSGRHAAPVAVEPAFADAHDRAGKTEAQHGEAHHQRPEMRPASDREDAHDANLQRDHRAGFEADGEIEAGRRLEVESETGRRGLGQRHGRPGAKTSGERGFTAVSRLAAGAARCCVGKQAHHANMSAVGPLHPAGSMASRPDASPAGPSFFANALAKTIDCRRLESGNDTGVMDASLMVRLRS